MGRLRDGITTLTIAGDGAEAGVGVGGGAEAGDGDGAETGGTDGAETGAGPLLPGTAIPLEVAASLRARTRGLLGRDGVEGALLLTPANSVHTFRMRFAIDVAYLSRDFRVLAVRTMRPGRIGRPRLRARHVLESEAGAMGRWGLRPGGRVRVG